MNNRPDLGRAASLLSFGAMAVGGGPVGMALFMAQQMPIWRIPGRPDEGTTLFDYVYEMMYKVEHIPIDQAIEEARQYYEAQQ